MSIVRFEDNPLIRPADVKPSRNDFEVVCVFNAGCIYFKDEILLLLRVAERPVLKSDEIVSPMLHPEDLSRGMHFLRVGRDDPDYEEKDARLFRYKGNTYLTSISHLRIARSVDGSNFVVEDEPAVFPETREEEYGVEDPRITQIDDRYYVNYTAVSRYGIATSLAVTRDFKRFERKGVIFSPDNRDITIFGEKISGRYMCYHRPMAKSMGRSEIWLADSPDLIHWGNHRHVCGTRKGMWDGYKIGGGAVPIKTDRGWLEIYHGADDSQRYCLGLILADLENPEKVLARSKQPLIEPEAEYEKAGFFGEVIFTCGAVNCPDEKVIIYYGSADEYVCAAQTTIEGMLATLEQVG